MEKSKRRRCIYILLIFAIVIQIFTPFLNNQVYAADLGQIIKNLQIHNSNFNKEVRKEKQFKVPENFKPYSRNSEFKKAKEYSKNEEFKLSPKVDESLKAFKSIDFDKYKKRDYKYDKESINSALNKSEKASPQESERPNLNQDTKTSVEVNKLWRGKVRGKSVINLLADGEKVDSARLDDENNWEYIFTDLPPLDAGGKKIEYTVEEAGSDDKDIIIGNQRIGFTIMNRLGNRNSDDSEGEAKDPEENTVESEKPEEGAVKSEEPIPLEPAQISIDVNKIWEGQAKESATVNLLADGRQVDSVKLSKANEWKYTFENLPTVNNVEDKERIKYSIEEVPVDGYKATILGDAIRGFTIINIKDESEKIEVTGKKVWIGGPSRKPTIELQLYRDFRKIGKPIELRDGESEYTWRNLEKKDRFGRDYKYTINEVKTPYRYIKSLSSDGLTITNRYIDPIYLPRPDEPVYPDKTSVTGKKIWIGGPDEKPTIELQLYRDLRKHGEPIVLRDGETEYTWSNLEKTNIFGKNYRYTVNEVKTPIGYRKSISDDGLTITNRYRESLCDSTLTDLWPDKPSFPSFSIDSLKPDKDMVDKERPGLFSEFEFPEGGNTLGDSIISSSADGFGFEYPEDDMSMVSDRDILARTGSVNDMVFYIGGLILILAGLFIRRKVVK